MVEGGTLLRCYTSIRGIEGSNPSSSAPLLPHLQDKHVYRRKAGRSSGLFYTNYYTNAVAYANAPPQGCYLAIGAGIAWGASTCDLACKAGQARRL